MIARGIAMFERVDVPVLGIVENMSYFLCPHCGERTDIFAHGGARKEADWTVFWYGITDWASLRCAVEHAVGRRATLVA